MRLILEKWCKNRLEVRYIGKTSSPLVSIDHSNHTSARSFDSSKRPVFLSRVRLSNHPFLSIAGGTAMATINRDNMLKTLLAINVAKQDRNATSGNPSDMRRPPVVLSPEWQPLLPGSHTESEPISRSRVGVLSPASTTAIRADRHSASRSGSSAVASRTVSTPFGMRYQRNHGSTGYRPGYGTAPASSRGK